MLFVTSSYPDFLHLYIEFSWLETTRIVVDKIEESVKKYQVHLLSVLSFEVLIQPLSVLLQILNALYTEYWYTDSEWWKCPSKVKKNWKWLRNNFYQLFELTLQLYSVILLYQICPHSFLLTPSLTSAQRFLSALNIKGVELESSYYNLATSWITIILTNGNGDYIFEACFHIFEHASFYSIIAFCTFLWNGNCQYLFFT